MEQFYVRRDLGLLFLIIAFGIAISLPMRMTQDNSCFDQDGRPWLGKIPHSTMCSLFYVCDISEELGIPIAILQECPAGTFYGMTDCECLEVNAVCFDPSDPEHAADRFRCATPAPPPTAHS